MQKWAGLIWKYAQNSMVVRTIYTPISEGKLPFSIKKKVPLSKRRL